MVRLLLREFYGKEASLFMVTQGSEEDKGCAKKGLSGVLKGADTERRRRILGLCRITHYVSDVVGCCEIQSNVYPSASIILTKVL